VGSPTTITWECIRKAHSLTPLISIESETLAVGLSSLSKSGKWFWCSESLWQLLASGADKGES
jgi:hypothetical protein